MLTPVFRVDQTEDQVLLEISAKYSKAAAADICIAENTIIFNTKPYYLRLRLSGRLEENEDEVKCTYDVDEGKFFINLKKLIPGEVFTDLDMLQKLLDTKLKATIGGSGIEVIADDGEDCEEQEIEDWEFAQEITSEEPITEGSSYGFANLRSDIFQRLREESSELFEYLEISTVKNAERTEMRVHAEQAKFDEDHYLSDLFEPDYALEAAMNYKGFWEDAQSSLLTPDEKAVLVALRKKSIPALDFKATILVYSGLLELMFSYCYVKRWFGDELEPEAGTMIAKISPMLSWLDTSEYPPKALESCFRRALIFPYHRSFALAEKCQKDAAKILKHGREAVTKVLLELKMLFSRRDPFYLFNQLYIEDYLIWMQSRASAENLQQLAKNAKHIKITKASLGLDLDMLEKAALLVMEDGDTEEDVDMTTMEEAMKQLGIELGADGEFHSELEKEMAENMENEERRPKVGITEL